MGARAAGLRLGLELTCATAWFKDGKASRRRVMSASSPRGGNRVRRDKATGLQKGAPHSACHTLHRWCCHGQVRRACTHLQPKCPHNPRARSSGRGKISLWAKYALFGITQTLRGGSVTRPQCEPRALSAALGTHGWPRRQRRHPALTWVGGAAPALRPCPELSGAGPPWKPTQALPAPRQGS